MCIRDRKLLLNIPGSIFTVKKIAATLPRISSTLPILRLFSRYTPALNISSKSRRRSCNDHHRIYSYSHQDECDDYTTAMNSIKQQKQKQQKQQQKAHSGMESRREQQKHKYKNKKGEASMVMIMDVDDLDCNLDCNMYNMINQ